MEKVPSKLRPEGQVRVRQSKKNIPSKMSRTGQGMGDGQERIRHSETYKCVDNAPHVLFL